MRVNFSESGIHLSDIDLWLDPGNPVENAWLSHAHSDHARYHHARCFGTAVTLEVYRMRWPDSAEWPREFVPMAFGEASVLNGAVLTAYPAGHIAGAAQLLVEHAGERFVYTGDIKLRPPMCGQTTEVVPCDRLVMESTFGLPVYHFLSREEAAERIVRFARETLEDGAVPVFLGYPLGRGQEIAHALCAGGVPASIHGAIAKYLPVYERMGYSFDGWQPYDAGTLKGRAQVVTPGMSRQFEASNLDCRIAYVSGWAALSNARARSGATELIPYSDHGDFEELLALAEGSGAKQIDLVHGYTEPFAKILREKGCDAHSAMTPVGVSTIEGEG